MTRQAVTLGAILILLFTTMTPAVNAGANGSARATNTIEKPLLQDLGAAQRGPTQGLRTFLPSVGIRADQSQIRSGWIIDRALAMVDHDCTTVPGETTHIYARFGAVDALETWLRDAAIAQTADIQGRPVAEVRQEWDASGMTFLQPGVLNSYDNVWFLDVREGMRCVPGPMTPPPGGVLPVYKGIYALLDASGNSLLSGMFSDDFLSYLAPPYGELIHSEYW